MTSEPAAFNTFLNLNRLFVTVRFERGARITRTLAEIEPGRCEFVAETTQPDYEYELYRLASALYPDCPSAGFEWLRFGRVLGPDGTSTNQNWQLVAFAPGQAGYIDLAQAGIVKRSDADFPHWLGWERIEEGQAFSPDDGLCDVAALLRLLREADANADGQKPASRSGAPTAPLAPTCARSYGT